MSRYVRPFSGLRAVDAGIAGGKGASLGELQAAGAPVPPGFVVLTAAWEEVLASDGCGVALTGLLADLHPDNAAAIAQSAAAIVEDAALPQAIAEAILAAYDEMALGRVAVRSSATAEDGAAAAWAGQLDTFLDIDRADVLRFVRKCWASLFTERALIYRLESGMHDVEVGVAVVVQQMIDADVAGVGFSVHPTTQEPDVMLIQGAFGLGEAVVSGAVTPHTWVVCKRTHRILDRAIPPQKQALRAVEKGVPAWIELGDSGSRPSLTDEEVLEYAAILTRIERHYGRPMDTEWALRGRLQVTQARPITTLSDGYDQDIYDTSIRWAPAYRRPFDLFASSLFAHALDVTMLESFGFPTFPSLFVELSPKLTQLCLVEAEHRALERTVRAACDADPARIARLLERGRRCEERVHDYIARGVMPYPSVDDALIDFFDAVAYGSQVPIVLCDVLAADPGPHGALLEQARQNRSVTAYPWFTDSVFPALLQRHVGAAIEHPMRVVTLDDLQGEINPQTVATRDAQVREGRCHVYQRIGGVARVSLLANTGFILARINGARVPRSGGDGPVIHGQAAYSGEAEGTARVVLHPEDGHDTFQDGDILVSVNANPSFMPLMRRASAIVTDEGGASCHAAIISRELKKPCVMGTGDATTRIRAGQRVRVDGWQQTVTILD